MNLEKYLKILDSGEHIEANSPVHQYMHQVSQEALRLTAELNGSYHTPEEIRKIFSQIIGKPVEVLSFIGRNSLYYLLMSNILIFAVAGSKFSYRANGYAYGFYIVLLVILTYLERQIRK